MADNRLNKTGLAYFWNRIKSIFATKSEMGILSDKVDVIISEGGSKIDAIKVNGQLITIANKEVDIPVPTKVSGLTNDMDFQTGEQVQTAISTAVSAVYRYKGNVASYSNLPAIANVGDVYDVQDTGMNYAWSGTSWDALGQLIDASTLWAKNELVAITTAEIDEIVDGKE